jgi:hypothetical protein
MQTRTYADLFALIQALCGVVFASIETGRIKALINRRAQRAYRSSNYWTRFLKIGEERAVGPGGSPPVEASIEIGSDDSKLKFTANPVLFVGADGNNCRVRAVNPGTPNANLSFSRSGNDQTINLATNSSSAVISTATQIKNAIAAALDVAPLFILVDCDLGTGSDGTGVYEAHDYVSLEGGVNEVPPLDIPASVVPYFEAGLQPIDTFLRIFKQAPYIASSVQEFDFTVTADGATLVAGDLNPSTAFLTYKAQFTDTYGDGAGETSSVPAEWFQYLAHGTYADYLRAEGQQEKAALADQEAEALLTEELIRLDENHTSGFVSNRIRTNANMQLRW